MAQRTAAAGAVERAPRERGIVFGGPMVRAIGLDLKTQTRRVIPDDWWRCLDDEDEEDRARALTMCPYGRPGERLWVRETFYCDHCDYPDGPRAEMAAMLEYRADHECRNWEAGCPCRDDSGRSSWRSPRYMPRWASRYVLELTNVRIERLRDISEMDAIAEGVVSGVIPADEDGPRRIGYVLGRDDSKCILYPTRLRAFEVGWDAINGKRAPWASNPWAWALTFKRLPEASS